ncbi:MAG: peptidase M15 [Caulobacterales bacterium 68-7]|nr:D-alanyl-D-alanine carboxypeptidase [Caulobacterales bacterium]OJU11136.1 MAG: peptidase M15 [Caulobacterales bacterium 68-7]
MIEPARRLLLAFAAAATVAAPMIAAPAVATAQIPYLKVPAAEPKYAAIVVDANSGEVLYAKRADSPRYPASITKVMTLYLVFEALAEGRLKTTDMVTVSPRAAAQAPTKLGLRAGEQISVDDAIRSLCTLSANDMAVALAEKLGGSEQRFAAMMTLRARELGMVNSHFVNANGLPDSRQISSARDIALLSRAVMRDYPQYYSYFSVQQFAFRGRSIRNHNGLLGKMPGVDGLKTGYTNASGYNLAASAVRGGRRLIAVVLGGSSVAARDNNVEDLLVTGFDVLARRDRGEKITLAQNLFEPEPQGMIMRPSIGQGDGEQDGLQIALVNNPAAKPAAAKPAPAKAAAKSKGDYKVQVGAFKSQSLAREQIKIANKKFSKVFAGTDSDVERAGGTYRAQFINMTADEAQSACSTLKSAKAVCMVIKPS